MLTNKPKIVFVGNTGFSLFNYRLAVMRRLAERGCKVVAIANDEADYQERFSQEGIKFICMPVDHKGMNPISDIVLIFKLARLYQIEKPAVIHHFTIKPVIMGTIAAKIARAKIIVNTITGLGYAFEKKNWLQDLVIKLYRFAMKGNVHIIFQNRDNRDLFLSNSICSTSQAHLVPGSGIDTCKYIPDGNYSFDDKEPLFLLATRMLWSKGIAEFADMSQMVRAKYCNARFVIVGGLSGDGAATNPQAIPHDWLMKMNSRGCVEWLGRIPFEKVMELLKGAYAAVVPSYHEGLPRFLVEAGSLGKPLVAFDVPGCREVVNDEENGYLVQTLNTKALAEAVFKLLEDPKRAQQMGEKAREQTVRYFDDAQIYRKILGVYSHAGFSEI